MPNHIALPACKVDGCEKPAKKRGMCNAHYLRWHRKGTTDGRALNGDPLRYLRDHMWDECPKWPFARNRDGRGLVRHCGGSRLVHRIVCEVVHGPQPSSKHEVAHDCGKGHLGCFGAACVQWKLPAENQMDRIRHGTSNRGRAQARSKLSEQKVRAIRRLKGHKPPEDIAVIYSVSKATVYDVWTRRSWGWLS